MSKRFLTRWLLISLGLHLLAAVFSTGYQNSDEHFQILEFLNAFMGRTPWGALPIEYIRMIRPWFQPFLYWPLHEGLLSMGVTSPFTWALADRLLSALIGWTSVVSLALCIPIWLPSQRPDDGRDRWQRFALILLCLTWYLPAFHARHSSENLSGALFTIGLCGIVLARSRARQPQLDSTLQDDRHTLSGISVFFAGVAWGLAFEARFQVGIMIAGAFAWLVMIARLRIRELALLAAGIALAIGLGSFLDFVGYGQWTFAPWNYFKMNLLEGYANSTDTSPWWDYFRRIWTETWPVLGFIYFAGLIAFWFRYPKHILTWALSPFFIVHMTLAHKETRFLFPMAHAAPIALAMALSPSDSPVQRWEFAQRFVVLKIAMKGLAWLIAILNLVALITLCFLPASPTQRFYKKVSELGITELYFSGDENPYTVGGIPLYFYRPQNLDLKPLPSPPPPAAFWYSTPSSTLPSELEGRCAAIQRSIPDLSFMKQMRTWRNWTLYCCR